MNKLVWFRSDLRTQDNQALNAAIEASSPDTPPIAVFFESAEQWQEHGRSKRQIDLLERSLNDLGESLAALGIKLFVLDASKFADIAPMLVHFCDAQNIDQIFANSEIALDERKRDQLVIEAGLNLTTFEDVGVFGADSLCNRQGGMFRVFSAYKRAWLKKFETAPRAYAPSELSDSNWAATVFAGVQLRANTQRGSSANWPAGEATAYAQLEQFCQNEMGRYDTDRDRVDLDGTSGLSPFLALGVLSARQAVQQAREGMLLYNVSREGCQTFISQIIWREFYRIWLVKMPELCKGNNFNHSADDLRWRNDPEGFERWCKGETGYPIVDAAMKQLNETGWMHNRLRMVVASFLSKHLLIDWRLGERYFGEQLIDHSFALNNGGWQWSAGTGCDAQPWFRVFNPELQSAKFDPDARFIKKYIPELAKVAPKQIHQPSKFSLVDKCGYFSLIVEPRFARDRALATFKQSMGKEQEAG